MSTSAVGPQAGGQAGDRVRVVLVDDQQMVRAGFRMLLESQPDLEVVGEAGDGRAAVDLVRGLGADGCDVVLMDVRMPVLDGVAATAEVTALAGAPRVLVLTTFDLDEHAFAAIRAGAAGFLLKDAAPEDLLAAVRTVHAGDAVVAPSTTRRLLEHLAATSPQARPAASATDDPRLRDLTEREREVLVLVGRGLSNHEITVELVVAEATVKTHVSRLLAKTGCRDRVQLVVLAHEVGLVG